MKKRRNDSSVTTGLWMHGRGNGGRNAFESADYNVRRNWGEIRKEFMDAAFNNLEDGDQELDARQVESLMKTNEEEKRASAEDIVVPLNARNWHRKSESPNALGALLYTPQVQFSCNFVLRPKIKRNFQLHTEEWNSNTMCKRQVVERRNLRVLEPIRKKNKSLKRPRPPSSRPENSSSQLSLEVCEESRSSQTSPTQTTKPTEAEALSFDPYFDLEIAKAIVRRESLIDELPRVLLYESAAPALQCLRELKQVSFEVTFKIYRWHQKRKDITETSEHIKKQRKGKGNQRQKGSQSPLLPYHILDFKWKGSNYILKLCSDMDALRTRWLNFRRKFDISEELLGNYGLEGLETIEKNPLLLPFNLTSIKAKLTKESKSLEGKDIWRLFDSPSVEEAKCYEMSWILLSSSEYFDELARKEAERLSPKGKWEKMEEDVCNPEKLFANMLRQAELGEGSKVGCWKNSQEIMFRNKDIALKQPYVSIKTRHEFEEKLEEMKEELGEHKRRHGLAAKKAAIKLQTLFRGYRVRKGILLEKAKNTGAAKIQRFIRTLANHQKKEAVDLAEKDALDMVPVRHWVHISENASINIQCLWRQYFATKTVQAKREHRAATNIASWFRTMTTRHKYLLYLTVRTIQKNVRMQLARGYAKVLRFEKRRRSAAFTIQKYFRVIRARRIVEEEMMNASATTIQSRVRGFLTKMNIQKMRCACLVQTRMRQYLAKKKVAERRNLIHAVKQVQRWQRFRNRDKTNTVQNALQKWRREHRSRKQRILVANDLVVRSDMRFHLCALYDHFDQLKAREEELARSISAKAALIQISKRIHKIQERKSSLAFPNQSHINENRPHGLALLSLMNVKSKYEHILRFTKHLSKKERRREHRLILLSLSLVKEKISMVETLVARYTLKKNHLDRLTSVVDVRSYERFTPQWKTFSLFAKEFNKAQSREQLVLQMTLGVERERKVLSDILRDAEWTHRGKVTATIAKKSELLPRIRREEARSCSHQISSFIKHRGFRKAVFRRVHRAKEKRLAKELSDRWDAMEAEDNYAQAHRGFLSVENTAIERAKKYFDQFDERGLGEITPKEFQNLAFDLGVTVPMSKVKDFIDRIDLNGNGKVDFLEYCYWYFVQSRNDRLAFHIEKVDVANAVLVLQATGLTAKLAANQLVRKAKYGLHLKQSSRKLQGSSKDLH